MSDFLNSVIPAAPIPAGPDNPSVVIIYGPNKIGKSRLASWASEHKRALWLDYERGSSYLSGIKIDVCSVVGEPEKIMPRIRWLKKLAQELSTESPPRFDYVIHDKLDTLENWAELWATGYYKNTVVGRDFSGESVLELPKGAGYLYLRNKFQELWTTLIGAARHSIFLGSLRDRYLDKSDTLVASGDLDLTGKVRRIAVGFADSVGYLYRDSDGANWLSFRSSESGTFAGSRCQRLSGQSFRFSWLDPATKELVVDWEKLFVEQEQTK